ncbi:citrate synthase/methylcitrate synthase, partial [Vibrio vulnificus]
LKGPLHGGANEAVMHTFEEIQSTGVDAKTWLTDALAQKKKIMGFGHRVYKNGDSRVPTMKAALEKMSAHYQREDMLDLYSALESAMGEAKN